MNRHAFFDELVKLGAASPGHVDAAREHLEGHGRALQRAAVYGGLGAGTGALTHLIGRNIEGVHKSITPRSLVSAAVTGAIGMGALPYLRKPVDRYLEHSSPAPLHTGDYAKNPAAPTDAQSPTTGLRQVGGGIDKTAWFGRYYHGTSPTNESSILSEGLRASHGGGSGGATQALANAAGTSLSSPALSSMHAATQGAVHVSPSKTVARMYGAFQTPGVASKMLTSLRDISKERSWREVVEPFKEFAHTALHYQPLQVEGKGLQFIKDPFDVGGLRHMGDIPASRITKAAPSRLGNLLRRLV